MLSSTRTQEKKGKGNISVPVNFKTSGVDHLCAFIVCLFLMKGKVTGVNILAGLLCYDKLCAEMSVFFVSHHLCK